jgi:hypothetical protein
MEAMLVNEMTVWMVEMSVAALVYSMVALKADRFADQRVVFVIEIDVWMVEMLVAALV